MKKRNIIKLTEQDLHNIILSTLNEVRGWSLEKDDIEWVNEDEDGLYPAYLVKLWCGSGYQIRPFGVYADSEEEALEKVVAYLDKEGDNSLFFDDIIENTDEALEDDNFLYIDATREGASEPHWITTENLSIKSMDDVRFAP